MRQPWKIAWIFSGILFLNTTNLALSCPNCKEAVSLQPGEAARMADGYNWSILFMLVVPFTMMGTGAMMVRRAAKKGLLPEI